MNEVLVTPDGLILVREVLFQIEKVSKLMISF